MVQQDDEHATLLLDALAWVCGDGPRAMRFLDLTGLGADDLRLRADHPATLQAVSRFLADHEPDLLACAAALGTSPQAIIGAGRAGSAVPANEWE